ncbi:MAG: hypothetical protein AAF651_13205 [Cyanobacteria bacterium P01_C01_bin.73]
MFFPLCFSSQKPSFKHARQQKLKMLKAMRDSLETRLAAINAAIQTIERQMADSSEDSSAA